MECTCGPNAECSSCPRNTRESITQTQIDLIAETQEQFRKIMRDNANYTRDYAIALGVLVDKLHVLDPPNNQWRTGITYTNNAAGQTPQQ